MSSVPSDAVGAIAAAGGTRISGPGALSGGWRRTVHLAWTLSLLEFRLKFFGSVLGYFWQLGRPLMMFGVYYVVFTQFVDLGNAVPNYAPMLLMGIMLYQFFAEATSASVRAVVDRENLVRKISFPRIVIPISVGADGAHEPRREPDRRVRVHRALGCPVELELPRVHPARRPAGDVRASASRCCSRRCSSTTATCSRSGRS